MNDTQLSRKSEILDLVSGETIVDVGSGGEVLLDKLVELHNGLTWQMMPSNCILAAECR